MKQNAEILREAMIVANAPQREAREVTHRGEDDVTELGGAVNVTAGTKRVRKGGAWSGPAQYLRAACRLGFDPTDQSSGAFGFRLVLPASPAVAK